jgi:hypothetical protein
MTTSAAEGSAAIPSFAPASWFSMPLLFGAHDEVTPVTENSSMKCLRIPLSRTRIESPRVACWDALIKLRGCVFPIASDFLLRQKRVAKLSDDGIDRYLGISRHSERRRMKDDI